MKEFLLAATGLEGSISELGEVGDKFTDTGLKTNELPTLIGSIINVLLGALGIVFVVLVIYAGVLYFTSQGEKEPTEKAKKILKTAVTGMVIIVAAYAISTFVMGALVTATT